MNTKTIFITALFTFSILGAVAQNTDEEAIKKVVRLETESYLKSDSVAWKDQFIQDENTTRLFAGNGFYFNSIPGTFTREFRTLVKENNQWKITSMVTVDSLSYSTSSPEHIEFMFNATGYSFLDNNKVNEAIEVFKLNVKLNPTAWNNYDSLGEAYAAAGNKDLAIENYRKSIELNPENEHGREMLAKLQEE